MNVARFILQNHAQVLELTLEHLWLVGFSTLLAVSVGVPLGIVIPIAPASANPFWRARTSFRPSPVLRSSDFCCPCHGWANVLIVWLCFRLFEIPTLEFEALTRRLWKQEEVWASQILSYFSRWNYHSR
jgi:hypothetical protein